MQTTSLDEIVPGKGPVGLCQPLWFRRCAHPLAIPDRGIAACRRATYAQCDFPRGEHSMSRRSTVVQASQGISTLPGRGSDRSPHDRALNRRALRPGRCRAEGQDRYWNSVVARGGWAMTADVATEVEKMRRAPGIIFVDSPAGGRVARVAGAGLEVFEIIKIYRACGSTWEGLKSALDWHSDNALQAALTYYELYPDEIDEHLRQEDAITPEASYARYPFMNPNR